MSSESADKVLRVVVVVLNTGCAAAKIFGSKMMSSGGKPLFGENFYSQARRQNFDFAALTGIGLPCSSKAITTTYRGAVAT